MVITPVFWSAWQSLNWTLVVNAARRHAKRAGCKGQSIGRPKALDKSKTALAQRMHASGESAAAPGSKR